MGFKISGVDYRLEDSKYLLNLNFELTNKGFTDTNSEYFEFELSSNFLDIKSLSEVTVLSSFYNNDTDIYTYKCAVN